MVLLWMSSQTSETMGQLILLQWNLIWKSENLLHTEQD